VATRDGLEAVLSRQRQGSRQRGRGKAAMFLTEARQGRGRGRKLEAEARQSEINVVCVILKNIMHNAHVVVTCSCFVVNDIYQ